MSSNLKNHNNSLFKVLCYAFIIFGSVPFLFPNPIVKTNIQPYAALIGTLVFVLRLGKLSREIHWSNISFVLGGTFIVSVVTMLFSGVTIDAIRGVYNYYALFIVPCATILVIDEIEEFPEKLFKAMILVWFSVSTIQFFIYRGFATQIISGVRWSLRYRGVVGLASEPSFLGIACFYFLHLIGRFKEQKVIFSGIVLIMGILYAQSTTGIMFIAGYYIVFLLDVTNTKKGVYIWSGSLTAGFAFIVYLNTKLTNSRLYQMINAFWNGGVDSVLDDGSASVRFNAIGRALETAKSNLFFPGGFGSRIGSAYGGMLVELGFFAVPAIILISYSLSFSFKKRISRALYFIIVTILLLNNTQIGNPLLLMIIGAVTYERKIQDGDKKGI